MAQPGIQDDDGSFKREVRKEIEERIIERAQEEMGEDVDLSQGSPIKQLLDTVILEHDYLWQLLEEVYYSAYYGHAYEEQLDKLLEIAHMSRIPRRGATGEVTFTTSTANDFDVVIPEGTQISTPPTEQRPSIPFRTTEPVRMEAGEMYVNAPVRAAEPWETDLDEKWLGSETNVSANTIERFDTAIPGVHRVTNTHPTGDSSQEHGYAFIHGRDEETDAEFRKRFEESFGSGATATLDALLSAVRSIPEVDAVNIEENYTMEDNVFDGGLPPKSFRLHVLGDANPDEVAQTIAETKAGGIQSFGEEVGVAITQDGQERFERFDWSDEVDIHMTVEVTHDDDFPADGSLEVENNIIEYVGGETATGDEYVGLGMGENVIYDMVFKQAMKVQGVWRVDVELGDDPESLAPEDVTIDDFETAMTDYTNVSIIAQEEERP